MPVENCEKKQKHCVYCDNPLPVINKLHNLAKKDVKKLGFDEIINANKEADEKTSYETLQSPPSFECYSCGKEYYLLCFQSTCMDCKTYVKTLLQQTNVDENDSKYKEIKEFMERENIQPVSVIERVKAVTVFKKKKNTYIEILFGEYYIRLIRNKNKDKTEKVFKVIEMYYLKGSGGESFIE